MSRRSSERRLRARAPWLRARQHLRALEVVGDLDQRLRRDDLDIRARPRRLRAAGRRADQPFVARVGADRRRQHARDRRDRAVEAEFAEHGVAVQRVRRDRADRGHQAERDRQIVMAAFLRQVGGRQIDRDPPRRQRQPRGDQRRTHPLAGLGHRLVAQADDGERRQTRRDLHLHVDRAGLDPLKGYGRNPLNHAALIAAIEGSGTRRQVKNITGTLGAEGSYVAVAARSGDRFRKPFMMRIRRRHQADVLHLGRMDHEPAFAAAFGFVHGAVGGAQEFVGGVAVAGGGGDADADADLGGGREVERGRDRGDDPPGDRDRGVARKYRGSRITNSSPPSRQATSTSRMLARRRLDTSTSTASPVACPSPSLTALKPSRSRQNTVSFVVGCDRLRCRRATRRTVFDSSRGWADR